MINLNQRQLFLAPVILLLLLGALPPARAQAAQRCFPAVPAIADCIAGPLGSFWERQGGLPVFGYPIGPEHTEQIHMAALTLQPFERARLELHPENRAPYDVLLGRLGADLLARQGRDWATFPKADPAAPHYFAATAHAIAPQFWPYWSGHGLELDGRRGTAFAESLALFGLPLSEAQAETNPTDGKPYLTQWFERARFEYHPEHAGTPYEVLLGLLQRELQAGPAAPSAAQDDRSGGFIEVAGAQLTRLGQPVLLKGVNYYPQWRPWGEMWKSWDGPQTERELREARDQLGINVVRVLLPYNVTRQKDGDGVLTPELITRLHELAQIAGNLDMRLLVTLFDFYHDFPAAGSASEARNLKYLHQLIPEFAGDDRIFAWDLHNEPDHYETWRDGDPQQVLSWLGRMADVIHSLAPKQLVTVGMGQSSNLWLPGPDRRRVLDYSDVISMHSYDAGTIVRELDDLRAQTGKPILIEEFGWPTGPACVENYSEQTQERLYKTVLAAAKDRAAGVLTWTLRDFDSPQTLRWDSREEHFGLFRPDGSLKPAAQLLRALAVPRLPSDTSSNLTLSSTNPHFPTDERAPVLIAGSGHYVKSVFRRAWELFGGAESFGLPLTEAFKRPADGVVVQYFEKAALEHHPELGGEGRLTPEPQQIMQVVRPVALGGAAAGARAQPPAEQLPQGPFRQFYDRINGAWRLGQPISAQLTEQINGAPTSVQYFQNGRLELNPSTQNVEIGRLGQIEWSAQCQAAQAR